jgi:hypothetical protein
LPDRTDALIARLRARGAALAAQAYAITARVEAVVQRLTDPFACD